MGSTLRVFVCFLGLGLCVGAVGTNSAPKLRKLRAHRAGVQRRERWPLVQGCSIYILDLNHLARQHEIPECRLDNIVVDARTQVPYLKDFSTANKAKRVIPSPHYFSGNSAPWFTRRAIERSQYLTNDIGNASVILVDDYCFKLWWLSYIHSSRQDQLPGSHLVHIYEHMMRQPEWLDAKGARHVFFQSHTGFAHGPLGDFYERFLCETLVNSMHIVNVRASRLRCKSVPYNPGNFLIAPGSVHYHDIKEFQERERERLHSREGWNHQHERDFLLFFKGKCTPLNFTWKVEAVKNRIAESTVNVGKLMRVHIVRQIQGMGQDVRAACTGDAGEMKEVQNERPHWEQMDEFTRSTFCLLVSGDSQTSRRLPEAIMSGCIPVFPGPPYHTMPFAGLVDYKKFALFFHFKKTPWADSITIHWEIDPRNSSQRPHHPTDAEWWVPDVEDIRDLAVEVEEPADMIKHLREIPEDEIIKKQQAVLAVQPQFAYLEHSLGVSPSAADLIARAMCERWQAQKSSSSDLLEPQPIPHSFSKLATGQITAGQKQETGVQAAGKPQPVLHETSEEGTAVSTDEETADASLTSSQAAKSRLRETSGNAARAAGEKPRLRRKRKKELYGLSTSENAEREVQGQAESAS